MSIVVKHYRKDMIVSKSRLKFLYWSKGFTQRQIADLFGCSAIQVSRKMRKYDITRRTKSEACLGVRNSMFGKKHSRAVKALISKKNRLRYRDPEALKQLSLRALKQWKNPIMRARLSAAASKRTGENNSFFGKKHTLATKRKLSIANTGRFVGSKGSNWQGGKTTLQLLLRNSKKYTDWRNRVFERDKYICKECGRVGGPLNADHIKPFSVILSKFEIRTLTQAYECVALWRTANGRTLCVSCHKKTETYGWKSFRLIKGLS